ncbi:hypothetical protein M9Y10_006089 [Tritrichomonas musculus]|uniref:HTH CENPB-type domain-containing protein n=1 Tax=Tritrichomonas musculus TaxID=1915356 RepID=A0ABR2JE92_9EUKA
MFDEKQKIFESILLCIKRGPYIKYQKFPETVEKVMLILKNYEKGDIQKLVQKTGFKERTMYNWLENIKKNPNFSPLSIQIRENARIFTEDEEDAIAHYILIEKINQCILFTDEDCLEILVNAYLTKHQNDENIDYTVSFSRGYIYNFKKRHSFVSKVCHLKRRPSSNILMK